MLKLRSPWVAVMVGRSVGLLVAPTIDSASRMSRSPWAALA
jgi:hypothetical protein